MKFNNAKVITSNKNPIQLEDFWKVSTVEIIKIPLMVLLNVRKCMALLLTMRLITDEMYFYDML